MKKLSLTVMGLAVAGVLSFGASTLSESKQAGHGDYPVSKDVFKQYAAHGDTPAPQKPNLAYTHGETWSPAYDHGRPPMLANADGNTGSPSYSHADTPVPADNKGDTGGIVSNESVGDHGGSPSYEHGDTPAPAYSHADLPISAERDHGGSPSYGHADLPTPQA